MKKKKNLVQKGLSCIRDGLKSLGGFFFEDDAGYEEEDENMRTTANSGIVNETVKFSEQVLDEFRKDVGKYRAETGGMLASSEDKNIIDKCYFDTHSSNTPGTFYYDVKSMSAVFRDWKSKGYTTNGIYHSHPRGATQPSYHDISTALLHIDFFDLDYFYLPIFQPERRGFYEMYFYVVRKMDDTLVVNLDYVLRATEEGYVYAPFHAWKRNYPISQLRSYRNTIDNSQKAISKTRERNVAESRIFTVPDVKAAVKEKEAISVEDIARTNDADRRGSNMTTDSKVKVMDGEKKIPTDEYFKKVLALYPSKVLDKVIVCIGTGGARSFLENCARSGFRNYVLIDADVVSPSNIATQGVFISEIGRKKIEVTRDRIMDINPDATVVCVDKFLDDSMSDEEFKGYMDKFPRRESKDYLILGCTDNFEAQKRSSLLALKYGTPYLAAMMYEGGAAAEIIFVYPGVTESCPRCLLRDRFEKYENGFVNNVDSSACPIFATERMNALKGYIALMLLMYNEDPANPFSRMLDDVKDRNFVEIRLNPFLKDSKLGIGLFDKVFADASRYVYFDETIWVPQHPDRLEFGSEPCRLCGGTGELRHLQYKWKQTDTRSVRFDIRSSAKSPEQVRFERTIAKMTELPKAAGSFETKV